MIQISNGLPVSKETSTVANATIAAFGVVVEYTGDDYLNGVFEQPPNPERFNIARLTYASPANSAHHEKLSLASRAGLGLGICLATGIVAYGMLLLWSKMRRRRPAEPKAGKSQIVPSRVSLIPRQPVPSAELSRVSPKGIHGTGYNAVNTVDDASDSNGIATDNRKRRILDDIFIWKWEVLSLFIGVLSLLAIISLLYVYENRLLKEWRPQVSINAVVSILSAIFKGSLALPLSEGVSFTLGHEQSRFLHYKHRHKPIEVVVLHSAAAELVGAGSVRQGESWFMGLGTDDN